MNRISLALLVFPLGVLVTGVTCSPVPEPGQGPRFVRPLPQTIVQAENPPPPVSGGTLHVTDDELYAVASDPDRDVIWLAPLVTSTGTALRSLNPNEHPRAGSSNGQLETLQPATPLVLAPGAEPGRIAQIDEDEFLIVLRGRGEVLHAVISEGTLQERARRSVCAEPRGVDYDTSTGMAYVACRGGNLINFQPADTSGATQSIQVEPDLRDVVVLGDRIYVSTFRSAEIFILNPAGGRVGQVQLTSALPGNDREPSVAWRMRAIDENTIAVAHQLSRTKPEAEPVEIEEGGYGGGGGFGCPGENSIVIGASTIIQGGEVVQTTQAPGVVLPVDIAAVQMGGFDGDEPPMGSFEGGAPRSMIAFGGITLAAAGDISEPFAFIEGEQSHSGSDGAIAPDIGIPEGSCSGHAIRRFTDRRQTVAVDTLAAGWHISQTRLPHELVVSVGQEIIFSFSEGGTLFRAALPGETREDTGHDLFHRDSGAGLACASCHPEGTDDGQVWSFATLGDRRTPQLRGGILAETAPFHWAGDMTDFSHLSHEVFTDRMGGPELTPELTGTMETWIDTMPPLNPPSELDASAVARGAAIFYREDTGCITCHSGDHYTNNDTVDVGTGGELQVPPLVGLAARAPYMHDGCAPTLTHRFADESCGGGDRHGKTSQLSAEEIGDLVTFLWTL